LRFLGRAKKFLQDLGAEAPPKVQTFNLACPSGHRVRGERTEGYQALRCPACGEGVFVLPRSPLPEPIAPAGAPAPRGAYGRARSPWADEGPVELDDGRSGGDGAEIIWDDETAEVAHAEVAPATPRVAPEDLAAAEIEAARRTEAAADRERRRAAAPARRESPAGPAAARPARPRRARAGAPAAESAPVVIEARPRARRGPRLGLIFLLLTLLIAATIGWRVRKNRLAQYPLIAQQGRDEGIPALDAGDFDRAHQLLSAAKSAVNALGGAVEGADEIRQAADEATIFVNLCPRSLEDLLDEAGRTSSPDAWASKFETLYKGHYYVFDSFILSTPQPDGTGTYELGYVVFPPGEASRFSDGGLALPDRFARIDLAGFELFEIVKPTRAAQVTFGAKLHSIGYDSERKHWMVRLEPKSGVFITHHGPLQASGWPAPETIELPREDQP
jgi:hypothetical protein